jgi:hypothetical protein
MTRKSLSTLVFIMTLMFMPGEVSCIDTHRPGSIIDIKLEYQPNNDLLDTSDGCPTVVAKISIDDSIQTFVSLSRTKPIFSNVLLCIDKSCLNTTYVSNCPIKVEI